MPVKDLKQRCADFLAELAAASPENIDALAGFVVAESGIAEAARNRRDVTLRHALVLYFDSANDRDEVKQVILDGWNSHVMYEN